jgi:hypothetical protein
MFQAKHHRPPEFAETMPFPMEDDPKTAEANFVNWLEANEPHWRLHAAGSQPIKLSLTY